MSTNKEIIHDISNLKKGDIVNIYFWGHCIKENCLIVDFIQDHYFTKGLVVYLNGKSRESIDLENNEGLWVEKSIEQ